MKRPCISIFPCLNITRPALLMVQTLLCLMLVCLVLAPAPGDAATRTIRDRTGRMVTIPDHPGRIACLFGPSFEKLLAFGAADRVSMVANVALPWNFILCPSLNTVKVAGNYGAPDVEELLRLKTDLVIYHPFAKQIQQMTAAGLPVVVPYDGRQRMHSLDDFFKDWYAQIRFYGQILGGPAVETAEAYCTYVENKIQKVVAITSKIPREQRPRVFYFCGQANGPAGTQTRHATADWLVTAAGGIMLTHDEPSYFVSVTPEQMILWDPDIIMVSTLPDLTPIVSNPMWKNLKAVKNNQVFMTPQGQFYWSHFSTESFLCILFMAKRFYPDRFAGLDMVRELIEYYDQFYQYDLSRDQASRILAHLPPASSAKQTGTPGRPQ